MSLSVQSEVGQLRQAIVHRPGLELARLTVMVARLGEGPVPDAAGQP